MKTSSLDMLSSRRENYLIIDRILRVLTQVPMYSGLPSSLYRVFLFLKFVKFILFIYYYNYYYYFFNEINNTISIQVCVCVCVCVCGRGGGGNRSKSPSGLNRIKAVS